MSKQQNIWKVFPVKWNKNHLLILLLIGVLLLVIAIPTESKEKTNRSVSGEEARLASLLEQVEGVGEVTVMMTWKEDEEVEGVAIVTESGEDAVAVRKITEIVQALFPVDSHKIKVIKGNQTK